MNAKTVEIKFTDGNVMVIGNVEDYGVNEVGGYVFAQVGGYNHFFNFDHVIYIGTADVLSDA